MLYLFLQLILILKVSDMRETNCVPKKFGMSASRNYNRSGHAFHDRFFHVTPTGFKPVTF